ncbi:MAG TPA: divalent metal cation transporter FieF, partial [Holosporales bacterium]|nr:divalent metal cation transporter FieF [Holosporales bacterium]
MVTKTDQKSVKLLKAVTYASVSVAVFLLIIKSVAWIMTDSVSIQASLVDSLVDTLASLVNFFAIRHALVPADREHRFGHGKIEAVA